MKKMKLGLGLIAGVGLLLLYLLAWPIAPRPIGVFVAPEAPLLTGIYEQNNRLQAVERFGDGPCLDPEDIAVDTQGRIYAGMANGQIMRFSSDGSSVKLYANTGGRPLGLAFDANGNLIVADKVRGLLSVSPSGSVSELTTEAEGKAIVIANDLDIASDGIIYFSDYQFYPDYLSDFTDGRPLARLLAYDPRTQETRVVLDGLYAANGVVLGHDEAFILVNEMAAYRISRYWLTGPQKGQVDVFVDNLPGIPDNITFNGRDTYWLALYEPRSAAREFFQARPFLRGVLKRIPSFLLTADTPPLYGFVLGLDQDGNVTQNLQDPSGEFASHISCAYEYKGMLYLGNTGDTAIYRLAIP
jgi:sugar lactone lactonase YvrE